MENSTRTSSAIYDRLCTEHRAKLNDEAIAVGTVLACAEREYIVPEDPCFHVQFIAVAKGDCCLSYGRGATQELAEREARANALRGGRHYSAQVKP